MTKKEIIKIKLDLLYQMYAKSKSLGLKEMSRYIEEKINELERDND